MKRILFIMLIVLLAPSVGSAWWDANSALTAYLAENYPWDDIRIAELKIDGDAVLDKPDSIAVEKNPPGYTVFKLRYSDGTVKTVRAQVKAYDRVVMTRRPLSKGMVLSADDVYETLVDITRIAKGSFRDIEDVSGKTVARTSLANRPVTASTLQREDAVKRGSRVMLTIGKPGLEIRAMGQLSENGRVGDIVTAVNLSSKKSITGILLDNKTVKVRF